MLEEPVNLAMLPEVPLPVTVCALPTETKHKAKTRQSTAQICLNRLGIEVLTVNQSFSGEQKVAGLYKFRAQIATRFGFRAWAVALRNQRESEPDLSRNLKVGAPSTSSWRLRRLPGPRKPLYPNRGNFRIADYANKMHGQGHWRFFSQELCVLSVLFEIQTLSEPRNPLAAE